MTEGREGERGEVTERGEREGGDQDEKGREWIKKGIYNLHFRLHLYRK